MANRILEEHITDEDKSCQHDWHNATVMCSKEKNANGFYVATSHETCRMCGGTRTRKWETPFRYYSIR